MEVVKNIDLNALKDFAKDVTLEVSILEKDLVQLLFKVTIQSDLSLLKWFPMLNQGTDKCLVMLASS